MYLFCMKLTFWLAVFGFTTANAQIPDTVWTKVYGGAGDDVGRCVQSTADGGYVIVGHTGSSGAGAYDVWLLKTDSLGNILWTRTYGGYSFDGGHSVEQVADGGYIIAGSTRSFGDNFDDLYIVRTDSTGDTLWTSIYSLDSAYVCGHAIKVTHDGMYVVAGSWDREYYPGGFLMKLNTLGSIIWDVWFPYYICDVIETSDHGYVVTGAFIEPLYFYNLVIYKIDSLGNIAWSNFYEFTSIGSSVIQTAGGGYIIAGSICDTIGDWHIGLFKTDSQGDTMWTRTYAFTSHDIGRSVKRTPDNGYAIAGCADYYLSSDVCIVRTDSVGDTLWTRIYGGSDRDEAWFIEKTNDGGYIIVGSTESFAVAARDLWVLRLSTDPYGVLEGQSTELSDIQIYIHPNPFRHRTRIQCSITDAQYLMQNPTFRIYDAGGRWVKSFDVESNAQNRLLDISWSGVDDANRQLGNGVYFLKLQVGDYIATEKLLLIR